MNAQPLPDWVKEWLDRARSDLVLCQIALETPVVLLADACYHAQQSAEKALKALLTAQKIPCPRTHSLDVLLGLPKAGGVSISKDVDESFELSQYAVQTRYPGDWEPITREEAERAYELAKVVLEWVQDQVENIEGFNP